MTLKINNFISSCRLETPTLEGNLPLHITAIDDMKIISSKLLNQLRYDDDLSIRIHSSCFFSEQIGALDCDCLEQLKASLWFISNVNNGIIFYLNQEGRGHGVQNKINICNSMQDNKIDTYEACKVLGLDPDVRDYKPVIDILRSLRIKTIHLITNNPSKINAFKNSGIKLSKTIYLPTPLRKQNREYLYSKQTKGRHNLDLDLFNYSKTINFYHPTEENGYLSNLSKFGFKIANTFWLSVEHFYKSHKYLCDLNSDSNLEKLKKIECEYQARADWDYIKQTVMFTGLYHKFSQNPNLKQKLLDTQGYKLCENSATDYYWGIGENKLGENILGRLLMQLRVLLQYQ